MAEPRWDEQEIARIVSDLMEHFQERDAKLMLRDALVYRREWDKQKQGQYVPPPFDRSRSIIQHATGILADRAIHLASKVAENSPNIQVNTIIRGDRPPVQALRDAKRQEDALNALYWEAGQAYSGQMQQMVGFSAVTKGVGWYLTYENALGWKVPERTFYTTLTPDEAKRLMDAGQITDVFPKQGREFQYAETLDLWERRKFDAQREAADQGESLFIVEVLPPGSVYYRKDTRGISLGAVVEEVPQWDIMDEFGVQEDAEGNVVIGTDRGGPPQQLHLRQTWLRIRIFTRDEIYYYVSRHQGGKPMGAGEIVFHTRHDYGEVPLFPAAGTVTDSPLPEEEYLPPLEGAYAMVPGYNQVLTLLSNAAVFNTTPRYVILRADGSPVLDPDTGDMMMFETDSTIGLDPQYAAIIETGGGQFQQLKIENVGDLVNLMELYARELDKALPPEAALGSSGAEEPAWGTRLKQAAANVKIAPAVRNHAGAVRGLARMWTRVIRHRNRKVVVYGIPQRQGRHRSLRSEITLDPTKLSMDISVRQRESDAQERIVKMQTGMQLRFPQSGRPVIDDIEFYEEWMEADDPIGMAQRSHAQMVVDTLMPQMLQRVLMRVQGRLAQRTPAEMEEEAQLRSGRSDMLPAEPAGAAGIRQPGVEQGLTMDSLPDLQTPAGPVRGELPV